MDKLNQYVTLSNGLKMPTFGLGTVYMSSEEEISNFVKAVVEFGYRHIDTASFYGNEEIIGKALEEIFAAGIKREELFIVTKIWNTDHDIAEEALATSRKRMQLDFVDLYLIHFPVATKRENDTDVFVKIPLEKTWRRT
jgi:diketogulonate reductase-like aldo/keto reductase